jgi:UDP-GlcNAc:undecaprenyl-phosphate GlcNAc-1-phosphate transferase
MFFPLPSWPVLYLYTGAAAFVLAAFSMPVALTLLRRFNILDRVTDEKIHTQPTPRGGGIVIFLAFALAVLLPDYRDNPMKGVLLGSFICLIVGAIDDLRGGVPAVIKLVALTWATLIMSLFGVQLSLTGFFLIDLMLTWLWIVGVTSAFNGIDNMDGLASGVAVIVSGMYLAIALDAHFAAGTETSLSWFGLLASGLIGSNLGFLLYNFKPAKVFMGDSGSFFLGFTLAALGVMGEWADSRIVACTIPVLILAVPIFDFTYILIARIFKGQTRTVREVIEHCAPDHLSHRLVWLGFSQRRAVLFIYLMAFVLGLSGILLRNSTRGFDSALGLVQGVSVVALIVTLMLTAEGRQASLERKMGALIRMPRPGSDDSAADEAAGELRKSA